MIPTSKNLPNENSYQQKIKIQLTNDNRCIIQSTLDSPNKSHRNTINKSEPSINGINYTDNFNDNDLLSLSKSINSNRNTTKPNNFDCDIINNNNSAKKNNIDNDGNSNLLISFSNISELTKFNNNENSVFGAGVDSRNTPCKKGENEVSSSLNPSFCNIFENSNLKENNKEKIDINNKNMSINMGLYNNNKSEYSNDKLITNNGNSSNIANKIINNDNISNLSKQLMDSFNKNNVSDVSDIVNWNLNSKSIMSLLSNKETSKKIIMDNNLEHIDIKDNLNINNKKKDINKNIVNKKIFKNIKTEKTNIIQIKNNIKNSNTQKNKEKEDNNTNKENIVPNHCTNFSFGGNIINNNINHFLINNINNINIEKINTKLNFGTSENNNINNNNYNEPIKNDDYMSPTFNFNLDYNALDNNINYNNSDLKI